jgi:hypothetical protein
MGTINRLGRIALVFTLLSLVATAAAATGTIQVYVHPGSGTVCLDTVCKVNQGTIDGTGSTMFENIEADRYYMLNVYGVDGYQPYLKQVYLGKADTILTRDVQLEPVRLFAQGTGTVQIFITPDGGQACLDRQCDVSAGNSSGSWSVQFTDITANTYHTLTLTHTGYETYTKQVRVLPGQTSTLDLALKPLPAGSAPAAAPVPLPTSSNPPPTKACLPGMLALAATGICGFAVAYGRSGKK